MPSASWDRLADAKQPQSARGSLSIVTLGHVHNEDLTGLTTHFARLEQLVLDVPPRDPLAAHRAEFHRALDAATADWVLVVREREVVDDALGQEIAAAAAGGKARGFRIRSVPFYAGEPLRLGPAGGEVRLFHRRYFMRFANKGAWEEITVQGTVMRLEQILRSITFASAEEHREFLAKSAAPHSALRRVLLFCSYVVSTRARDANTLRYLWIEAGFDLALRQQA